MCLFPLADCQLWGPCFSVVFLHCGLTGSTECLQAFVTSSKIINQTCRGTRCLFWFFFLLKSLLIFRDVQRDKDLKRKVWQLSCLMSQILSISLKWCEKLRKTWFQLLFISCSADLVISTLCCIAILLDILFFLFVQFFGISDKNYVFFKKKKRRRNSQENGFASKNHAAGQVGIKHSIKHSSIAFLEVLAQFRKWCRHEHGFVT